jgi:predicted DNA-binding transcriptional regulator YafY
VRSRQGAFTAPVPEHVDVRATVARFAGEGATATATVKLRRGAAYPLRATALAQRQVDADWDELEIPYGLPLAAELAEYGPDVVVLAPQELRAELIERLRAVAGLTLEGERA